MISRWDAVVDAVIAAVDTQTSAQVFDAVPITSEFIGLGCIIGARADDERGLAGTIRQVYHDLGPTATRDETGTIYCSAIAQTGDDDIPTMRQRVIGLVGDVETALRNNYDLDVAGVRSVEVELGDIFQGLTQAGTFAEVQFTIRYEALI